MKRRAAVVVFLVLAGCSGGAGESQESAPCGDLDTVLVDGTLEGKSIHETGPLGRFRWTNLGSGDVDVDFGGGTMHLWWARMVASDESTSLTAATLTLSSSPGARTFRSGTMVYDSPRGATESTLRTALTFDTGSVTVCVRKRATK